MYIQFSQKPDFLSFLKMSADRFFIQKHMLLKIANFPNMKELVKYLWIVVGNIYISHYSDNEPNMEHNYNDE